MQRTDAGKGFGSEEFQEEEIDALGEVGDVTRTKRHANVAAGIIEPVDTIGGKPPLIELEVPSIAED